MSANEYKPIEQLLKERIGLEPDALGPKAVEHAASERMRLLGVTAVSSYAALISTSAKELEALIEMVVIPESWFFRDREPFIFLAHFIRTEWQPEHAQDKLRILIAPCATGEEPYSIAMTCLDCGLKHDQFVVDATDINAKFLRKAQNAVYGRNSFRGADLAFRGRYFAPEGHEYSLKPEVRACVRFFKANIIEPESFPPFAPYDIVFCRNLLIYLHDQARAKTMAIIERLLAPGGLPGTKYVTQTLKMETPCTLYVVSDGTFEIARPDGAIWPFEDYVRFLAGATASGKSALDELEKKAHELHGPGALEDDFSILRVDFSQT